MGRRKRKKKQGFSSPDTKPVCDAFTSMLGAHGSGKRQVLNILSLYFSGAVALVAGFGGCFAAIETAGVGIISGWIIGLFAGAIAFNLVTGWLTKDRYFRP